MNNKQGNDRRSLIEGLKQTPPALDSRLEKEFVFQGKPVSNAELPEKAGATVPPSTAAAHARAPVSTRIRSDFAAALKRASLERQLEKIHPNTLQDILEEAIEPWLRSHGYLN